MVKIRRRLGIIIIVVMLASIGVLVLSRVAATSDWEIINLLPFDLPDKGNPKLDSQLNQLVDAEGHGEAASFAVAAMAQLQKRGFSFPSYTKFFETIKAFREQAGLTSVSWEDFDKYLWLYGQKKALDKGSSAINKEVRALYDSLEGHALFEGLEIKHAATP